MFTNLKMSFRSLEKPRLGYRIRQENLNVLQKY